MATAASRRSVGTKAIPIRTITNDDLRLSLRQGLADFGAMRGDIFFAGAIYTLVGITAVVMTTNAPLMPFFLPVVAGIGLLGPVVAVGFYELARRRERGERDHHWSHFFDVRKRPAADDLEFVAGLLLTIFLAWLVAAGIIYVVIFGWAAPASISAFLTTVFTTPRGWALIIAGGLVGAAFGWVVLSLSVASMPMLVDRDVGAVDAVSASWRTAQANRGPMIRWGIIVTVLLVLGSIPLFVGLAFVLPWLGYSTWHLYTRLIDREAIPARKPRRK